MSTPSADPSPDASATPVGATPTGPTAPSSAAPKATVAAMHVLAVALGSAYLLGAFGPVEAEGLRVSLLIALAVIYLVRLFVTEYVMVRRDFPWAEALAVGPWVVICQLTMAWTGGHNDAAVGVIAWAGVALYAAGSWLNTSSEAARKRWIAADPAHRRQVYTGHAFRYTRHPNYLGDSLLFTGFAMVAGSWWAALIPVIMTAMFVFMHIPRLDAHMAATRGQAWADYAARTRKLVPWVY